MVNGELLIVLSRGVVEKLTPSVSPPNSKKRNLGERNRI